MTPKSIRWYIISLIKPDSLNERKHVLEVEKGLSRQLSLWRVAVTVGGLSRKESLEIPASRYPITLAVLRSVLS